MATMTKENERSIFLDKMSFFQKIGALTKATSDDDESIPGYLFQEINAMTYESGSYCLDLIDYFVERLTDPSYRVKAKVLCLMKHLVENGHPHFRQGLRKTSQGIKETTNFGGPPDPLLGNAPYQNVRKLAKDLIEILFDIEDDTDRVVLPEDLKPTPGITLTGMGSKMTGFSGTDGKMQGFGNTPAKQKTLTESVVDGLKGFADKISDPNSPKSNHMAAVAAADRYFGTYEPVKLESQNNKIEAISTGYQAVSVKPRGHKRGVPGGGWADDDTQETDKNSQKQQSSDSTNSGELSDRLNNVNISDDANEKALIEKYIHRQKTQIPSRNNINSFIKSCYALNCERIVELLNESLASDDINTTMHALIMIEQILRTDLVHVDTVATISHQQLLRLYRSTQTPVQLKARKLIRILERISKNTAELFIEASVIPPVT